LLRNTFIHLPGIGEALEEEIWALGIETWGQFHSASELPPKVAPMRPELGSLLTECERRLADGDAAFFDRMLPPSERWRLYPSFRDRAAFIDIETTGLSAGDSDVTVVGVLDRGGFTAYVSGENLRDFPSTLARYDLLLTFNGKSFDMPFLEHFFGRPMFDEKAHIDLMWPLRRLGYRGGLKVAERRIGLDRSELTGLDGADAVRLWRMWEDGERGARDTLVRYNAEDVASLPAIAEFVYDRMIDLLPIAVPTLDPWPRADIGHLPFDPAVIANLRRESPGR
jgi:uncharacterized protein YprB with RNaseH-like and TPR domain